MLKRIARLLISLLVWLGDQVSGTARRLICRQSSCRGIVLYYHAVKPHQRAAFARQMDMLLRFANPWRIDSAIPRESCKRTGPSPSSLASPLRRGRAVWMGACIEARELVSTDQAKWFAAVTFDDGFASVVENALPELKRRNIPFTVFFPTGCWGAQPCWLHDKRHPSWEERVLSRDELRALAAEPLVTIGSHSVSHPDFLRLDRQSAAREFTDSKTELEEVIGHRVDLFSFPHGAHNGQLVLQALELGYKRLFSIDPVPVLATSSGPVLGRVGVDPGDWPVEFILKLQGAYRWMARKDYGSTGDTRATTLR